jgi:hypothetical protein
VEVEPAKKNEFHFFPRPWVKHSGANVGK